VEFTVLWLNCWTNIVVPLAATARESGGATKRLRAITATMARRSPAKPGTPR
jgi:hypothetical protein